MVTYRSDNTNLARIPALGARVLVCVALSILLMVLDHRQNHLDTVRKTIGIAVYPLQIVVDAPFRLWGWLTETISEKTRHNLNMNIFTLELHLFCQTPTSKNSNLRLLTQMP